MAVPMEVISGRAITHLSTGDNFDAPSSLQESLELLPLVTPELPAHDSTSNLSNTIELELLPSPELIAQDISFNTSNTIDVEPPTSPNISAQDPIINLSDTIDLESLSSPGTPIQTSNSDIPYRTNSEPLPPSEMNSIQDKNTDVTFPNLPGKRLRFEERMKLHSDPWLIRFFSIVLAKKSNIIVTTNGLTDYFEALEFANKVGPYIVALKINPRKTNYKETEMKSFVKNVGFLGRIAKEHNFLILQNNMFIDGCAYIVPEKTITELGVSMAVDKAIVSGGFIEPADRDFGLGLLALIKKRGCVRPAEMIKKNGEMVEHKPLTYCMEWGLRDDKPAVKDKTQKYTDLIWDESIGHSKWKEVDKPSATSYPIYKEPAEDAPALDDTITFNMEVDCLSEEQLPGLTPTKAILGGADFLIIWDEVSNSEKPVEMAKKYQREAWSAYISKTHKLSQT